MPCIRPSSESGRSRRGSARPDRVLRWLQAWAAALSGLVAAAQAPAPPARTLPQLKAFYQQSCARCHGPDGSARSADGKKLGGLDFTLLAGTLRSQGRPPTEREVRSMVRTIQKGIFFGLTMPAWKDQLSPEEATTLVTEVLLKAEPGKVIDPEAGTGGAR